MSRKVARRARFAYLARERRQDRSEVARIKRLYADAPPLTRLHQRFRG